MILVCKALLLLQHIDSFMKAKCLLLLNFRLFFKYPKNIRHVPSWRRFFFPTVIICLLYLARDQKSAWKDTYELNFRILKKRVSSTWGVLSMLLPFLTQKVIAYNTDWTNYFLHTVIATNPRIRVKVIILTLLEFTWACQQSNINLKLLLWRSTCTRIIITDEQSLILTQSRVYFIQWI